MRMADQWYVGYFKLFRDKGYHQSVTLKNALSSAYRETKKSRRTVMIFKEWIVKNGKEIKIMQEKAAEVWYYDGYFQDIRGRVLVRMPGKDWQILKSDGTISKEKVRL